MNLPRVLSYASLVFLVGCTTPISTQTAERPSAPSRAGTLQVQVELPPTWRPLFEDRITETFVYYIAEGFRQRGYQGEVVEVRSYEEPSPGCCLLTINLIEWRMNHLGNVDCTFSASVQTDRAARQLGVFTGMSFHWSGHGRFGLADAFTEAAGDAINTLYNAVAKTELVPGIRRG